MIKEVANLIIDYLAKYKLHDWINPNKIDRGILSLFTNT